MIYRLHYTPGAARDDWNIQQRYSKFLLAHALFIERQILNSNLLTARNEWGKPFLRDYPEIQYNISHCKGLVSCVLADVPVGIDAEYVRPFSHDVARRICSRHELEDIFGARDPNRRFFLYWTLKESCVKAMGLGLAYPIKEIEFRIAQTELQCLTQSEYRFLLLENASRYITAVCYKRKGSSYRIFMNV